MPFGAAMLSPFSSTTTFAPPFDARSAAMKPAAPQPTTTTSASTVSSALNGSSERERG